jgi:hypothetical protein
MDNDSGSFGEIAQYLRTTGSNLFNVNAAGAVILNGNLNFAQQSVHVVNVRAIDRGNRFSTNDAKVTINVLDVSDKQPFFSVNRYYLTMPENVAPRTNLTRVSASSNEPQFGPLVFSIIAGRDSSSFTIDSQTGDISTAQFGTFDYETKDVLSFVIEVQDVFNGLRNRASVLVQLLDINDNTPIIVPKLFYNISESTLVGSTVACVSATDADDTTNAQVHFRTIAGSGLDIFQVNQNGNITLKRNIFVRDGTSYTLNVEAFDLGTPSLSTNALLTFNVYRAFLDFNIAPVTIREDMAIGGSLGIAIAIDANTRSSTGMQYSVTGQVERVCNVDSTTGAITLASLVDREQRNRYYCYIQARGPTSNGVAQLVINVLDVNDETPAFAPTSYSISVIETTPLQSSLVRVTAFDRDVTSPNNNLRYAILSSSTDSMDTFTINPSTGDITLVRPLDYEEKQSHSLTINVTDLGVDPRTLTGIVNAVVNIQVQDYNDHCPRMQQALYVGNVIENLPPPRSIMQISATDQDGTPAHRNIQFSIDEPLATQFFEINQATGVIQSRQIFDYEAISQFRFAVKAINTLDPPCMTTVNVVVNVTNIDGSS